LVDYVFEHGGQELLDLGCGPGGYAKLLGDRGRKVVALDINEKYVAKAKQLGVDASLFDGHHIPLPDKSVDTIFMIEVMEHIAGPERLLAELSRVARKNIIITVPNCSQSFSTPVVFDHMLDADHKNFFTLSTLRDLLSKQFSDVKIIQVVPLDYTLAKEFLPRWFFPLWRLAYRCRLIRNRYFFRLIANATV